MELLPPQTILPTPSGDVVISRRLGSGSEGIVYKARIDDNIDDTACAFKVFHDKAKFRIERRAYEKAAKVHALRGKIPEFKGAFERLREYPRVERAILMSRVGGRTLRKVIDSLSREHRLRILRSLKKIVGHIHGAGFCHAGIHKDNIMVDGHQVWLIDFGKAEFKSRMAPERWEIRRKGDYLRLEEIFAKADARSERRSASALLTPAITNNADEQYKLAKIVDGSCDSTALLYEIPGYIDRPTPRLPLAISPAHFGEEYMFSAGEYSMRYLSREAYYCDQDQQRHRAQLKIDLARYRGTNASFKKTDKDLEMLLGRTHEMTLRARLSYAQYLTHHNYFEELVYVALDTLDVLLWAPEMVDSDHNMSSDVSSQKASSAHVSTRKFVELLWHGLRTLSKCMKYNDPILRRVESLLLQLPLFEQHRTPSDNAAPEVSDAVQSCSTDAFSVAKAVSDAGGFFAMVLRSDSPVLAAAVLGPHYRLERMHGSVLDEQC